MGIGRTRSRLSYKFNEVKASLSYEREFWGGEDY